VYSISAEDVLELWQASVVISRAGSQQRWDINQLANIVTNLHQQVHTLKKKMN
jgi:hypothetical protein